MIKELQPIRKEGNDLAVIAPDEYAVLWRMSIESKINELVDEYNYLHIAYHAEMSALNGLVVKLGERITKLEEE